MTTIWALNMRVMKTKTRADAVEAIANAKGHIHLKAGKHWFTAWGDAQK